MFPPYRTTALRTRGRRSPPGRVPAHRRRRSPSPPGPLPPVPVPPLCPIYMTLSAPLCLKPVPPPVRRTIPPAAPDSVSRPGRSISVTGRSSPASGSKPPVKPAIFRRLPSGTSVCTTDSSSVTVTTAVSHSRAAVMASPPIPTPGWTPTTAGRRRRSYPAPTQRHLPGRR